MLLMRSSCVYAPCAATAVLRYLPLCLPPAFGAQRNTHSHRIPATCSRSLMRCRPWPAQQQRGAVQDNAVVLCRQLGFQDGFLFTIEPATLAANITLAPPWLGGFRCEGSERSVLGCELPGFGNTVTCGAPQRLFCSPVGVPACFTHQSSSCDV